MFNKAFCLFDEGDFRSTATDIENSG